jgi:mRNA interferase MazF
MLQVAEIVLIPFPFTDLTAQKKRPVLVISEVDANNDFIALAITSKQKENNVVHLTNQQLITGSLPKESWIRTDKVFTFNTSLVLFPLAVANSETVAQALQQLCLRVKYTDFKQQIKAAIKQN